MSHIKSPDKIKLVIYGIFGLMIILGLLVVYIAINNLRIANSTNTKLIQSHTTMLDMNKFNKVLEQIKKEMK